MQINTIYTRSVIQTMAGKAIRDLRGGGERELRNVVELCKGCSASPDYQKFWSMLENILRRPGQRYGALLSRAANDVDINCLKTLIANLGLHAYTTGGQMLRDNWKSGVSSAYGEAVGHFASVELVLAFMEGKNVPFTIKKYQILGLRDPLVKSALRLNPRLFSGKLVQERSYEGAPVSEFSYDADGSLVRYWTDEISDEERSGIDDWGGSRFENRFFPLPNPFELGDIVRVADDPDSLGIVETSREDWAEWMRWVRKRKLPLDYYDSFIRVEFLTEQGTFIHSHIPPIDLERATLDKTDHRKELLEAGSRMLTGQISLECFSCAYHTYQEELRGPKRKNGT